MIYSYAFGGCFDRVWPPDLSALFYQLIFLFFLFYICFTQNTWLYRSAMGYEDLKNK